MKRTVDFSDFINEFRSFDRDGQLGNCEGLSLLFDYLQERERDDGEEMELDVIGLCCDYECATPDDIADDFSIELKDNSDTEDCVLTFLGKRTSVIGVLSDGRILYAKF